MRTRKDRKLGNTSGEQMAEALNLVTKDGLSIRQVSLVTGISYATLWRYVAKKKKTPEDETMRMVPNYYSRLVFTEEQEKALAQSLRKCSNLAYGIENEDARKLAFEFATKINVKVPETWVKYQMAGKDWMRNFLLRQKMYNTQYNPQENTFFTNSSTDIFFNNLQQILRVYPSLIDGYHIYNLGEITLVTISNNTSMSKSESNSVERARMVTICMIASAAGNFLPPAIIFPRAKYDSNLIKGAPCRTLGLANSIGSMTDVEFLKIINHFIAFTGSTKNNPSILILQNDKSSTSPNVVERAQAAGVILLALPPNSDTFMHPLNVSVYEPFKTYYKEACNTWKKNNSRTISIGDISPCIAEAFYKALTPLNILSGFKSSGIFPCKSHQLKQEFQSNDEEEIESEEECEELEENAEGAE